MSADLHIHVFADGELTDKHFRAFFSNTLGSRWMNPRACGCTTPEIQALEDAVRDSENIWVGEVSWLKAALSGDSDTFVPNAVGKVSEIIGEELPVIDYALIGKIHEAMMETNSTDYKVASADVVCGFLQKNKGKRAFTISW